MAEPSKDITWVPNFSGKDMSYQLLSPAGAGFIESQRPFFKEKEKFPVTKMFYAYMDLEVIGGYYDKKEVREMIEKSIEMVLDNPNEVARIHQETYKKNDDYFAYGKEIEEMDLGALSNEELGEVYNNLTLMQEEGHQHALISTWFIDCDGEDFSKILIKHVEDLVRKAKSARHAADVFSTLTTPSRKSFVAEEEIESLKLLAEIKKSDADEKILKELQDYSKIPEDLSDSLKVRIEKHFKEWRWLPFTYIGPAYDIDNYLSIWSGLLKEDIDPQEMIKEIEERIAATQKEREELFKILNVEEKWRAIFDLSAEIVHLKGHRKECSFYGHYVADLLFEEMSNRLDTSREELHRMMHWEIEDALRGKPLPSEKEMGARKEFAVMYVDSEGKTTITSGVDAKKLFDSLKKEEVEVEEDIQELKGTCASAGAAEGVVKIINSPGDMEKMNEGDILVSHTTFPSLVPAMKKAAAIVTEDGGITCHAAIVSRELRTPCVTGVKKAVSVLNDGDKIAVNANEGIITRLV